MVARQTSTRFLLKNLVQIWESGGCGFESHAECFFQICLGGFTIFGPCLINNVYDSFSMKVGGFLLGYVFGFGFDWYFPETRTFQVLVRSV